MPQAVGELHQKDAEPALRSLHDELLILMAFQAARMIPAWVLSSSLMTLLLTLHVPVVYAACWWLAVCICAWLHVSVLTALPDDGSLSNRQKLRRAAWMFSINGAVIATLFLFFPFVSLMIKAVITMFMVGLCASTLHATSGYGPIYIPAAIVRLLPISIAWFFSPDPDTSLLERIIIVGLPLGYFVALAGHARGTFQQFVESYTMRSERLDLNRQLRESLAEAESASRAKTRFLASASHDLRQPIHALSLFTGSLLLRPLDPRSTTIARQLDKAVKVLASQLDALLDISRLDAGVIEKSIATVDLQEMVTQLAEEFSPLAERKNLRLDVDRADGLSLLTDALLLQRILRNLLSNAIKYTERGSVVLRVERRLTNCRISVHDTGRGIPQAEHARIFEEFYQLNNPERDRTRGLGLGLAIVRRLTELLGLPLNLQSRPGAGSQFSIEVPLTHGQEVPVMPETLSTDPVAAHVQVLVVDDEEAIRLGMKTLLEEMGFAVRTVASTEAAIDTARQWLPSIVLADFRLRGDDNGMLAIRALRLAHPNLPALLISGDTAPDRLREAHGAGIELLHKPVDSLVLRESILKAVEA